MLMLAPLLALLCASCAEDRVSKAMVRLNSAAFTQLRDCYQQVYASEPFAAAQRHLPADYSNATVEQETDPGMARDPEIAAVLGTLSRQQECRNRFFERVNTETPGLAAIYYSFLTLTDGSLYEVMLKKKSWGDHVRDIKEFQRLTALDVVDMSKKIADGLSKKPEDVKARQEELDKHMHAYEQIQKALATMRRPIMTRPG